MDYTQLLNGLLDRGYTSTVKPVMSAIASDLKPKGIIGKRLKELETEAERLQEAGEKLTPDNPVFRQLQRDIDRQGNGYSKLVVTAGGVLASQAIANGGSWVRQTSFPDGVSDRQLLTLGIQFNQPNPEAVKAVVDYTSGSGWNNEIAQFAPRLVDDVAIASQRAFVDGWGALRTARHIKQIAGNMPAFRANSLMRTLQVQSFTTGMAAAQVNNADILEGYQVRIAAMDERTCPACIALHGTRLPLGAKVQDHHSGRCTAVSPAKGFPLDLSTSRVVDGKRIPFTTGQEYFDQLPEASQRKRLGAGAFDLYKAGRVQLRDFVQPYEDQVFNEMIRTASLKSLKI